MKLSILMPVYNERAVVERCISGVLTAPLPENMERELVIVDDCPTDGTYAILERLAAAFPAIHLHRHAENRGKGAAVRTAIEQASGDFSIIQASTRCRSAITGAPMRKARRLDGRTESMPSR